MPIFEIGKSIDDVECHRYENWSSVSGSSLSGSIENSLSRSRRCFQINDPGEVAGQQNYYGTTRNITPGPGTYEVGKSNPQTAPYSPMYTFGNSTKVRPLSESNRLWAPSDNSIPAPNAYNVRKPSTEDYLKNLLGVSKWRLKNLKRKLSNGVNSLTRSETRTISSEIKLLEKRVKAINKELSSIPPPVSPIKKNKNPFLLTEKKPHDKKMKFQDAPTFYMNEEKDWDFGSHNRGLNVPDMSSFGYSKDFIEKKEEEEQSQADIITGASRPKSRCRNTDFFGPNKEFRNKVPPVGSYSPELVPSSYQYGVSGTIKSGGGFDDSFSTGGTLSTHSSWNSTQRGSYQFNFARSANLQKPRSATLPRQLQSTNNSFANTMRSCRSTCRSKVRRDSGCSELTGGTLPSCTSPHRSRAADGKSKSGRLFSPIDKK